MPTLALASPPEGEAEVEAEAGVETEGSPEAEGIVGVEAATPSSPVQAEAEANEDFAKRRRHLPWIRRWAPEKSMGELGIYGGAFFPSPDHELFSADPAAPDQGFKPLAKVAPEVGVRLGYYPLRWLGFEFEGGVMPTRLREVADPALLYTVRGHVVLQLGLWSVTPFLLVGGGGLGVASDPGVLGNDLDPMVHFGGGLKFYLNRYIMLRIEARDVVSHKRGVIEYLESHNPEVLLGLSFTLGREKDKPAPVREEVAVAPSDRDNDGIDDALDRCPDEAESANGYLDEDGCPEYDADGDGIWDEQDPCPNESETINNYLDEDGCPESDRDTDGMWDEQDTCPDEPETFNGYQDADGCADEVPEEVRAFTGTIKGITFENNSEAIRPVSRPVLDRAVDVLSRNPDVRINIVGHTDSKGDRDYNISLSQRRAASVKTYLVERGIAEDRITTEGVGPDQPLDTNDTKAGRANNRRIEFQIIQSPRAGQPGAQPTETPA
ncbi:MAG TPA: OmpA family protein, partial [Enhygromyxa sp.]|nr:OmpA family protein [Enhygromyxa sp.]